ADGDDDVGDRRRASEVAHDHALYHHAYGRRLDEQHDDERQGCRPAVLYAQLPVAERGDHRDCAVGEVEDARRGVRDDEPARGDEVDAGKSETEDRVAQQLTHPNVPPGSVARVALTRNPVAVARTPWAAAWSSRDRSRTRMRCRCVASARSARICRLSPACTRSSR